MNFNSTNAPEKMLNEPATPQTRPAGLLPLVLAAGGMELLYLWIFRLNNLKEHVETFILLVLLQGILYFVSLYFAENICVRRSYLVFIFVTAAVFRMTLFPLYPSLSDDLVRYRWDGKAQAAGYNPYVVRPGDPKLAFLKDETYPAVVGPQYTTLYGPVVEQVFWVAYVLLKKVVAMKLPFILLDLGVALVLFRMLPLFGISPMRAIVYAWNPLIIVEFAASGHNDPISVFTLILALLFFHNEQRRLSLGTLAISALSKIYAGFLFPVFLFRASWRLVWIPLALGIIAFAPYGQAWRHLIAGLSEYGQHWTNNESLYHLIRPLASSDAQAGKIYLAVVAAVIIYCLARKLAPERATFLILATVLLFSPNVFPWYLSWIVPLLAIYPNPAWLVLTITSVLSYHVLIPYRSLGLWQENHFFVFLEYAPFFVLLMGKWLVERFRLLGNVAHLLI